MTHPAGMPRRGRGRETAAFVRPGSVRAGTRTVGSGGRVWLAAGGDWRIVGGGSSAGGHAPAAATGGSRTVSTSSARAGARTSVSSPSCSPLSVAAEAGGEAGPGPATLGSRTVLSSAAGRIVVSWSPMPANHEPRQYSRSCTNALAVG